MRSLEETPSVRPSRVPRAQQPARPATNDPAGSLLVETDHRDRRASARRGRRRGRRRRTARARPRRAGCRPVRHRRVAEARRTSTGSPAAARAASTASFGAQGPEDQPGSDRDGQKSDAEAMASWAGGIGPESARFRTWPGSGSPDRRGGRHGARRAYTMRHPRYAHPCRAGRNRSDQELLDNQPRRPRQVDTVRSDSRAHRAPSTRARCATSTSTRWISSASGE